MARSASNQPTEVEMQILQAIWNNGTSTAREIHNAILKHREINYSTTVKMLSLMLDKGLVKRDDSVRPQKFRAVMTQQKTQTRIVKDLIKKVYDGSSGSLVMQALSSKRPSAEELAEIRRLLDEIEQE